MFCYYCGLFFKVVFDILEVVISLREEICIMSIIIKFLGNWFLICVILRSFGLCFIKDWYIRVINKKVSKFVLKM